MGISELSVDAHRGQPCMEVAAQTRARAFESWTLSYGARRRIQVCSVRFWAEAHRSQGAAKGEEHSAETADQVSAFFASGHYVSDHRYAVDCASRCSCPTTPGNRRGPSQ